MERNIGDQLNKAFEAYRQVSIEKDIAKKELQKIVTTEKSFFFFVVIFTFALTEPPMTKLARKTNHSLAFYWLFLKESFVTLTDTVWASCCQDLFFLLLTLSFNLINVYIYVKVKFL